jgi:dipeptidyl-peptidase-4
MDRDTGYWWSPDERYIALQRTDEIGVDIVPRLDITGGGRDRGAAALSARRPSERGGRPVCPRRHDRGVGSRSIWATNTDIYLARVNWSADGKTLYVQRESRDQKTLDLLSVDPATGASRVIVTQTSRTPG